MVITHLLRPVRFLVIAFACALLFFSSAFPATAANTTSPSKPSEGETQLKKIYDESEKVLDSGLDSIEEISKRAQRGINEVQGSADMGKMSTPENSQDATTFKDQVKRVLDKVTPNS
ncbi:hypothetical protein OsccyDRAFT_4912 [Leptolyngbyaceae cyanobacterium JSC-12]|nr:hypothetical protein OsccyDRAFT_4912 [Leptolyngbyaceae cyanobacterium JSC-12]